MTQQLIRVIQARMTLYAAIRTFFATRSVQAVETPILSLYGATDRHTDSLITRWQGRDYYLHTSPELAMKRLLVAGVGDCYQLGKVFRDEQQGRWHRKEFTMLEWYRLGFSLEDLMTEVVELVKNVCPAWQAVPIEYLSYRAAFARLGINPHQDSLNALKHKTQTLSGYLPQLGDDRDEWLDFLLVTQIERQLGADQLTFLTHYPASQAILAKKTLDEQGNQVAERFELYYQGIELANGFCELTDADEQLLRFQEDNQQRLQMGKPTVPIDSDFIAALKQGLPACSGVALGVDRLLMLKQQASHIDEILGYLDEQLPEF